MRGLSTALLDVTQDLTPCLDGLRKILIGRQRNRHGFVDQASGVRGGKMENSGKTGKKDIAFLQPRVETRWVHLVRCGRLWTSPQTHVVIDRRRACVSSYSPLRAVQSRAGSCVCVRDFFCFGTQSWTCEPCSMTTDFGGNFIPLFQKTPKSAEMYRTHSK